MTHKKGSKLLPPFKLDMPFGEALERFIKTDPRQVEANVERSKQKKPSGGKKKRKPPDAKSKDVISLRERLMRKRNYGR